MRLFGGLVGLSLPFVAAQVLAQTNEDQLPGTHKATSGSYGSSGSKNHRSASLEEYGGHNSGNATGKRAGPETEALCKSMATNFKPKGLEVNGTFAQYFPEGANPSIELLGQLYPAGTIPKGVQLAKIYDTLGPDADIRSDAGYGKSNTRAGNHGPVGGLPAFCRIGLSIKTSQVTSVFSEVWLPVASDPNIPLVPVNETDFPQNTTAFLLGTNGKFDRVPLFVEKNMTTAPIKAQPGATVPPSPNDYPAPKAMNKTASASDVKEGSDSDKKPETAAKPPSMDSKESTEGKKPETSSGSAEKEMAPPGSKRSNGDAIWLSRRSGRTDKRHGDDVLGHGDGWNGRLAVLGNGGQRGFVPFPEMKLSMSRYRFAVAGTNLGHFSASNAVTWVNGTQFEDTLTDFAYRANHVTLQFAEQAIDAFYGATAGVRDAKDKRVRRYYMGSSVGGGRALSAMAYEPTDYHGLLIGPPAANFMNFNVGQLHTVSVHNKTIVGKDGFFTQGALQGPIRKIVLDQCDGKDGVVDNVISDPFNCKPDFAPEILCGGSGKFSKTNGTCLTQKQLAALAELYKPTYLDGKFVYPQYLPGLEDSASSLGSSNAKASGWTQLVAFQFPKLKDDFNPFTDIHYDELAKGIAADPGRVNAAETDFSKFIQAGGKALMYHGTNDLVISPVATIQHYEKILKNTPGAAEKIKLYIIPGMRHSRGGPGAWNFGGAAQSDPGSRPLFYNTKFDMVLALVDWVEGNSLPSEQVGAAYTNRAAILPTRDGSKDGGPVDDLPIPTSFQNYNWGVQFTRPLCQWPKMAKYKTGEAAGVKGYRAFACE